MTVVSSANTALVTLDTSKAAGPDDIVSLILKNMCQFSHHSSHSSPQHLPSELFHTRRMKGTQDCPRLWPLWCPQLSLLCIFVKILETIKLYDKIINFILPQISSQQFGFFEETVVRKSAPPYNLLYGIITCATCISSPIAFHWALWSTAPYHTTHFTASG